VAGKHFKISLSYSTWAAITKCYELSDLNNIHLFPTVLKIWFSSSHKDNNPIMKALLSQPYLKLPQTPNAITLRAMARTYEFEETQILSQFHRTPGSPFAVFQPTQQSGHKWMWYLPNSDSFAISDPVSQICDIRSLYILNSLSSYEKMCYNNQFFIRGGSHDKK
jgi:hypothetical protein